MSTVTTKTKTPKSTASRKTATKTPTNTQPTSVNTQLTSVNTQLTPTSTQLTSVNTQLTSVNAQITSVNAQITPSITQPTSQNKPNTKTPLSSKKGRTSKKLNGTNSQAKLKYINSCVKNMIDSLPRQTFSQLMPLYYETPPSYTPITGSVAAKKIKRSKKKSEKPVPSDDSSNHSNTVLSSPTSLFLDCNLMTQIPVHPNIHVACSFCSDHLVSVDHFIEQPHTRRRFTPLCESCSRVD